MTINTYADLLANFSAENFALLNRRIYKDTECGASISIYGTVDAADATPEDIAAAERAGLASGFAAEYARVLDLVQDAYRAASPEDQKKIIEWDEDAHARNNPARFMEWARTVVPGAFPETVTNPTRVPVAYHNGHRADIPASFILTGFTIQTIVEGSDATVDSDMFRIGTTTEDIDAWIVDMEAEAEFLWREANEDYPEVCPVCGADSYDADTDKWVFEAGPYCCAACRDKDYANMRAEAEAEAAALSDTTDTE